MKFLHAAAFAAVLALTSVPVVCAQEPDQDKEKPKQQDTEKKKQPADKDKAKPKSDDQAKPDTRNEKDKPKPETDRRAEPQRQDDRARQDDKSGARQQQQPAENQANRNGNGGRRIPEERFRVSFGNEHHFRVARGEDRRFAYGGYSFEYVDAWPSDWSYDDDVYIVMDGDDYYLLDANHPNIRLRIIIVG
jgi:hypothetical protein